MEILDHFSKFIDDVVILSKMHQFVHLRHGDRAVDLLLVGLQLFGRHIAELVWMKYDVVNFFVRGYLAGFEYFGIQDFGDTRAGKRFFVRFQLRLDQ